MLGLGSGLFYSNPSEEWLPTNMGDLQLWLRQGVDVSTSIWRDQSGNDNHAIQETELDQAAVSDGGLDFEQSEGDHYDLQSTIAIPSTNGTVGGFVIGIMTNIESYDGTQNTFLSSATDNFIELQSNDKFRINMDGTTSILLPDTNNLFQSGTKFFFTIVRDNDGAFTLYKNGSLLSYAGSGTQNLTNTDNVDINALGCRNKATADRFFDGIIFEVIVSTKYSEVDVVEVNNYLGRKL
jgi:hypothetical protein